MHRVNAMRSSFVSRVAPARFKQTEAAAEDTSLGGRLKALWAQFGIVAIGTHFGVYFATLGLLFVGVKNGLLGNTPEERDAATTKAAGVLEGWHFPAAVVDGVKSSPNMGTLQLPKKCSARLSLTWATITPEFL